ncbi:hypothetical protein VN97_g11265 [Penicillium thymicola]|uniref:Uncharacterized protein n=1 Tax=Penicillium thymicola TaxID=293382 RepID=A0AAI9T7E4_PENTH|nr:hypothetical protein VN97_g11265 [Penicillium thymicola]
MRQILDRRIPLPWLEELPSGGNGRTCELPICWFCLFGFSAPIRRHITSLQCHRRHKIPVFAARLPPLSIFYFFYLSILHSSLRSYNFSSPIGLADFPTCPLRQHVFGRRLRLRLCV